MTEIIGTTAAQMRDAPEKALYVVHDYYFVGYAKDLARAIGRPDLKIVTARWLSASWRGTRAPVVVDHALESYVSSMDRADFYEYRRALARLTDLELLHLATGEQIAAGVRV